jgi:hypothetical protein
LSCVPNDLHISLMWLPYEYYRINTKNCVCFSGIFLCESCPTNIIILDLTTGAGIAQWYGARLRVDNQGFRRGWELFSSTSCPSGAHIASYPMGTRGSFLKGKRPGREADHPPPSCAEVKNVWSYTFPPQYAFIARCSLKTQGKLYLYILLTHIRNCCLWHVSAPIHCPLIAVLDRYWCRVPPGEPFLPWQREKSDGCWSTASHFQQL